MSNPIGIPPPARPSEIQVHIDAIVAFYNRACRDKEGAQETVRKFSSLLDDAHKNQYPPFLVSIVAVLGTIWGFLVGAFLFYHSKG